MRNKFGLLAFSGFILFGYHVSAQDTLLAKTRLSYQFDFFDESLPNWNTGEIEFTFVKDSFTVLPRVTLTRRFETNGALFEADVYKTFKNGDYINFGLGYSPVILFPRTKANFEYYNPFAKSWEYSLGIRILTFEEAGLVGVGTASLSRYYGSFLTILRANVAYGVDARGFNGMGGVVTHRYYIGDVEYLGAFASFGYDASLIAVTENLNFGESPNQVSAGLIYLTETKSRRQFEFGYYWTRFNFSDRSRNQHTLRVSIMQHRVGRS